MEGYAVRQISQLAVMAESMAQVARSEATAVSTSEDMIIRVTAAPLVCLPPKERHDLLDERNAGAISSLGIEVVGAFNQEKSTLKIDSSSSQIAYLSAA